MAITLEKFTEVATVGNGHKRHALSGEWRYDADNVTRCGETATGREIRQSGRVIPMDCDGCARVSVDGN
jgi:hypothetical protein